MNLSSFILERALKQLKIPESSLTQFKLVSKLGDVDGKGFPSELIELSAPMVVRGLLNFSILQMNRDWIYPFWVHQQLDPQSPAFVATSQNPLLINTTNRNWTALGSPTGVHEAIVDPRGLVTPLPREWSVDTWLSEEGQVFFPSVSESAYQQLDTNAPLVTTAFFWRDFWISEEAFVGSVKGGRDVVFCRASVFNASAVARTVRLCVALRPFCPEGVAPIRTIEFKSNRIATVDGTVGVVFAQEPSGILFGSSDRGDIANALRQLRGGSQSVEKSGSKHNSIYCEKGMAQAGALFDLELPPAEVQSVCYSIALGTPKELARLTVKGTWKVSFERRRAEQLETWRKEISKGAAFQFGDGSVQQLFDASRLTLLQLQDGAFVSPGPFLYHHFWFRDAAPMLRALDVLGYPKRVREVIDGFSEKLTPEGFFRAPGGEWDSNGAALWTINQHYQLTRSQLWLKRWYPRLAKAGRWIIQMRRRTRSSASQRRGLMPKSLSAEHFGTVDQYYWDSFWSLAGLKVLVGFASELHHEADARLFEKEAQSFDGELLASFQEIEQRLGASLIPSTPFRSFDESAIGSICSIYPLNLYDKEILQPQATVRELVERFVDNRGFFHPMIHSGYNPYLTLQLAHALLFLGETEMAWKLADSVFRQTNATYTFPEAIHPKTGGGSMGDGHHGWAAAEVILFLRDCLIREDEGTLKLLSGAGMHLLKKGRDLRFIDAPTAFGTVSFSMEFESDNLCNMKFSSKFHSKLGPEKIILSLPWKTKRVSPSAPQHLLKAEEQSGVTILTFSSDVSTAVLQFEP